MALTAEQQAELLALSPADLVKKLANQAEILDRHDTKAQTAEQRAAAAEKKVADDAEAARLATLSEVDKAKAETAKERKLREDAEANAKRTLATATVTKIALRAGAIDENDVLALLGAGVIDLDEAAITEKVDGLKAKYPALFGAGDGQYREGEDHPRGGTGTRRTGAPAAIKRSAFAAMPPHAQMEHTKKGGTVTD